MIESLVQLLRERRAVILTGAGCSTESGIPDYRGAETRNKARNPIQYRAFITEPAARQKYWARSTVGWKRVARALPNPAHIALADMEEAGLITGIITQNVDRLHHRAGSHRVVELHGALSEVYCLSCEAIEARDEFQLRLEALNPGWKQKNAELAPDGDAELDDEYIREFRVPACMRCEGILKPNVVFFGENVPKTRVGEAWKLYDQADALVVVGSSLAVYSGYRFVLRAVREKRPVAMITLGASRGESQAEFVIKERAGEVLPGVVEALVGEA